jgi:hypothetical protein
VLIPTLALPRIVSFSRESVVPIPTLEIVEIPEAVEIQ